MTEPGLRPRLLIAALSDHEGLSAALAAAQAAEAWLRGDGEADLAPAMLSLPAPTPEPVVEEVAPDAPVPEVDVPVPSVSLGGNPTEVFGAVLQQAGIPAEDIDQAALERWTDHLSGPAAVSAQPEAVNGHDARSDVEPDAPDADAEAPTVRPDAGWWIEGTIKAVRHVAARDGGAKPGLVALQIGIKPGLASWRMRELVQVGRLRVEGDANARRYFVVGEAAPEPPAPPPRPAPAPRPRQEPPRLPVPPVPMSVLSVDKVAPALPVEFVSIEGVATFLRRRDFGITGGPEKFTVDGQRRDAAWLLQRANTLRDQLGMKPFSVGGPNG